MPMMITYFHMNDNPGALSFMDRDVVPSIREVTAPELLGRSLNDVESKHAPARLFVAGDANLLLATPRVSVVGARRASPQGLATAHALAAWLVGHSIVVVSGLAEGVDTMAHETAVASSGRTIAVLGTALSEVYPAKNRALQQRIIREHLAISPMRNRTMALLSDATIIVEAGEKSGSLHQGWEALRLGRPLFVMQSQLDDTGLQWPRELARYGAQTLEMTDLDTLADALPERAGGASSAFTF
jgi:DNA processing protein